MAKRKGETGLATRGIDLDSSGKVGKSQGGRRGQREDANRREGVLEAGWGECMSTNILKLEGVNDHASHARGL